MRAFRAGSWAVGLLLAMAACGRIGYPHVLTGDERDGPVPRFDAGTDGIQPEAGTDGSSEPADQRPPGPDLGSDQAPGPDLGSDQLGPEAPDMFTPPDGTPPRDTAGPMEVPVGDAGVERPPTRTVVAMGQNLTARRGAAGAGTTDVCPDGRLLVGYEGTQSTNATFPWIQSMVGICATIAFPSPGSPAMVRDLTRLPVRGSTSGRPRTRMCPTGQVLVGFDGNAGSWVGQLVLRCAPITLAPSGEGVVLGSETELDDVGAQGDNDFPQTDCPAGQAARGAETRTGTWLELFALVCATLVLR